MASANYTQNLQVSSKIALGFLGLYLYVFKYRSVSYAGFEELQMGDSNNFRSRTESHFAMEGAEMAIGTVVIFAMIYDSTIPLI